VERTIVINDLARETNYFAVIAYNSQAIASEQSNIASNLI